MALLSSSVASLTITLTSEQVATKDNISSEIQENAFIISESVAGFVEKNSIASNGISMLTWLEVLIPNATIDPFNAVGGYVIAQPVLLGSVMVLNAPQQQSIHQFGINVNSVQVTVSVWIQNVTDSSIINLVNALINSDASVVPTLGTVSSELVIEPVRLTINDFLRIAPDIVIQGGINIDLLRFGSKELPQLSSRKFIKMDSSDLYTEEKHRDINFGGVSNKCHHSFYDVLKEDDNGYFIEYRNGLRRYTHHVEASKLSEAYYMKVFNEIVEFNSLNNNPVFFSNSIYFYSYFVNAENVNRDLDAIYKDPVFLGENLVTNDALVFKEPVKCGSV